VLEEDLEDAREAIVTDAGDVWANIVEIEDIEAEDAESEVETIEMADAGRILEISDNETSAQSIPSSPALGYWTDDRSLPPSSDAGEELVDEVVGGIGGTGGWSELKRKHLDEVDEEERSRWKTVRRETVVVSDDESPAGTDDDKKRSRSAVASRKLKQRVKSGGFVVDERKRKRFEEKCIEMDGRADFCYRGASWQVLHSKCLKWYAMSEPYNATRFRTHLGKCKARGEQGNLSIMSFFKPKGVGEIDAEAKTKITPSARKQIFVGGATSASVIIKPPHTDNGITLKSQPCCGVSDTQNPLVSTYISRTVVEGAGSISLKRATQMTYGNDVKYSELTNDQKAVVATTQAHLRLWTINRELRVVFSTKCTKFVEQDRYPEVICGNCDRVAQSDAFRRSLRVKQTPLDRMKYIPTKYRGPMEDLGAKFASTRGLAELLQDVSSDPAYTNFTHD
jgi:hypothetical protein